MPAHVSQLSAGLGVCTGKSAVQKSSTVNTPSFFSAPYTAMTLPEREDTKQRGEPSTGNLPIATLQQPEQRPVTHLSLSILPSSLILCSSSSRISLSVSLMYLTRAGWGRRLS